MLLYVPHMCNLNAREVVGWCAECVRLIAMMVLPQVTCLYYEVKTPFGRFLLYVPQMCNLNARELVGWCADCVRLIAMMVLPQVICLYYEVKNALRAFFRRRRRRPRVGGLWREAPR